MKESIQSDLKVFKQVIDYKNKHSPALNCYYLSLNDAKQFILSLEQAHTAMQPSEEIKMQLIVYRESQILQAIT